MAKYYGDGCVKELIELINKLSAKHGVWEVFNDFIGISAIAVSNSVDWIHKDEREKQYFEIIKKYDKNELELFPKMLVTLVEALKQCAPYPDDILGNVFHQLELHNKYCGQFFTPQSVCDMMAKMSFSKFDKSIAQKGYISVCEPCAGSGAMILGLAKTITNAKHNYCKHMVVTAIDVDLKCVWMTYLQLSLYGIPAVVIHGNSLTLEEWSQWVTPIYIFDGWLWKQRTGSLDENINNSEKEKTVTATETISKSPQYDIGLKVAENGQMSLF